MAKQDKGLDDTPEEVDEDRVTMTLPGTAHVGGRTYFEGEAQVLKTDVPELDRLAKERSKERVRSQEAGTPAEETGNEEE